MSLASINRKSLPLYWWQKKYFYDHPPPRPFDILASMIRNTRQKKKAKQIFAQTNIDRQRKWPCSMLNKKHIAFQAFSTSYFDILSCHLAPLPSRLSPSKTISVFIKITMSIFNFKLDFYFLYWKPFYSNVCYENTRVSTHKRTNIFRLMIMMKTIFSPWFP